MTKLFKIKQNSLLGALQKASLVGENVAFEVGINNLSLSAFNSTESVKICLKCTTPDTQEKFGFSCKASLKDYVKHGGKSIDFSLTDSMLKVQISPQSTQTFPTHTNPSTLVPESKFVRQKVRTAPILNMLNAIEPSIGSPVGDSHHRFLLCRPNPQQETIAVIATDQRRISMAKSKGVGLPSQKMNALNEGIVIAKDALPLLRAMMRERNEIYLWFDSKTKPRRLYFGWGKTQGSTGLFEESFPQYSSLFSKGLERQTTARFHRKNLLQTIKRLWFGEEGIVFNFRGELKLINRHNLRTGIEDFEYVGEIDKLKFRINVAFLTEALSEMNSQFVDFYFAQSEASVIIAEHKKTGLCIQHAIMPMRMESANV